MTNNKTTTIEVELCSTKVAAEIFGCSGQHLRDLAKSGEVSQTGRGKYDLRELAQYMLQANKADLSEMQKARLKNEEQKARKHKLQNDELDKKLIRAEEVDIFLRGYTGEIIQFYEAVKKKTGAMLNNETRKKFFKAHEDQRTILADKLAAWVSDSLALDKADDKTNDK